MATQKFMGSNQLIDRLANQVGSKEMAIAILQRRGHLEEDGRTFTEEGLKRNAMTASQRAKDRASKRMGIPTDIFVSDFIYNEESNTAKKIK